MSSNDLLESLLNDYSLNCSQIKNIYSSFEDYEINLCSLSETNTSLTQAFSVLGNSGLQKLWPINLYFREI